MIRGLDTSFLVQAEVCEHPGHRSAHNMLDELFDRGDTLALAPQVLGEFVHIVSDERRFARPLTASQALARAELWWHAQEVVQVYPDGDAVKLFFDWMRQYRLGRKRLLDTFLAATYFGNGVTSLLSTNARDFTTFGCFELLIPKQS